MRIKLLTSLIFVGVACASFGQKSTFAFGNTSAIGIEVSQGNEKNYLFDDLDYFYRSHTLKFKWYNSIMKWKKFALSLVIQPQIQRVQHQLYNEQFVRPSEKNHLQKREKYTRLKNLSIAAIEFAVDVKRPVFKNIAIFAQIGLGFAFIDTATERLARGFTFIENGNAGLEYNLTKRTSLRFFGGVGHVSNFNIKQPNSGYDIFNTGMSIRYALN